MRDRGISLALARQLRRIVGETAVGDRRRVDDGDDAVDGKARAHARPVERLDERLRQREAGCLDDEMIGRGIERQQPFDRGQEVVRDGAADAAIGEFDDGVFRADGVAAALQRLAEDLAVDADVAELVDDQREAASFGGRQNMADQCRFAGAEEAGDDGRRNSRRAARAGEIVHKAPDPAAALYPERRGRGLLRRRRTAGIDQGRSAPPALSSIERQVSWLADRRRAPPSQERRALPVAFRHATTRLQLRGQLWICAHFGARATFPFTPRREGPLRGGD